MVTGSTGQLGNAVVARARAEGWEITGLSRREPDPCDLTDATAVRDRVSAARPDLVVHAAAWTDVDSCEVDPGRARAANVDATRHVAEASAAVGAHLVYVSTDYVYDGTKDGPYVESDEPAPLSVYGRSKLAGERLLGPEATVVRTSWLCGRHGANAARTILRLGAGTGPLRFVDDQVGRPTIAEDLAALLLRLGTDRVAGIVHGSNEGAVTWYQFAREVLELAGHDPDRVEPIRTSDLRPARAAPRPANSVLAPTVLDALGYDRLPHHRESLPGLVTDLLAQAG